MIKEGFETFFKIKAEKNEDTYENTVKKYRFITDLFINKNSRTCAYTTQRTLNELYLIDIKKIINLSEKHGVNILFLKGIFMAADVYDDVHCRRGLDLDILVEKKDIYCVKTILDDIGYKYVGNEDLVEQAKINHLKFIKHITNQIALLIEVHINIFNPPHLYSYYTETVWANSIQGKMLDLEPILLSPQDRIIHSCVHFCIHCHEYPVHKLLNLESGLKLQILYDIALLIKKYGINVQYLMQTCGMINAQFDLFFALSMLNKIVPALVPTSFLKQLEETSLRSEVVKKNYMKDILLHDLMTPGFGERCEDWIQSLPFNFDKTLKLNNKEQDLFCFSCEDFDMEARLSVLDKLIFKIIVRCKNHHIIDNYEFVSHSHQKGDTEPPCIKKYACCFYSTEGHKKTRIHKPFEKKEVSDIRTNIYEYDNKTEITYFIPISYIRNAVLLSMNVNYKEGYNKQSVCVTGRDWIDIPTMVGFKV